MCQRLWQQPQARGPPPGRPDWIRPGPTSQWARPGQRRAAGGGGGLTVPGPPTGKKRKAAAQPAAEGRDGH
jgi:hypothetical protein